MRIIFHDLFCLFFIILFRSYDSRIVFNKLTWVDSSRFLYFFNWFFSQFHYSILDRLGIELYNLFWFAFYRDILVDCEFWHFNPVKSSHFFYFFLKRLSQSHDLSHWSFNNEFYFYWDVPVSWAGSRVWRVNPIDSVFYNWLFPPNSSFNIVFDWELGFMICFGLFFIRLFRSHDPMIVLNRLTRVDLAHFLCHFIN